MPDLRPAVGTVIHKCLEVEAGEDVLVIVDADTRAIGEALRTEAVVLEAGKISPVSCPRGTKLTLDLSGRAGSSDDGDLTAGIGGTVSVPIHLDVVVLDASLEVDGRPILEAGRDVLAEHVT